MSETVQVASTLHEAGATKSAMKNLATRGRKNSAKKVVISDNPMN